MTKKTILTVSVTAVVSIGLTIIVLPLFSDIQDESVCSLINDSERIVDIDAARPHVENFGRWRKQVSEIPGHGEGPSRDNTTCALRFDWKTMKLVFGVYVENGELKARRSLVRAYMALDANSRMKLYFVPIEGGGDDAPDGRFTCAGRTGNFVLNLTTPCPKTCGGTGELRQAFLDGWNNAAAVQCGGQ